MLTRSAEGAGESRGEQDGRSCEGEVGKRVENAGQVLWSRFVKGPSRRS